VKNTSRFFTGAASAAPAKKQVLDKGGTAAYVIEAPENPLLRNAAVVRLTQVGGGARFADYQADTEITCKAIEHSRLYVSAEGMVFPCCWTGALYPPGRPAGSAQMWDLVRRLPEGKASLDGRVKSIREIVEGPFFQELVPAGWERRSVGEGRLEQCVKACGAHDIHAAQYGASLL
jgi:hypothetical protein